MFSLSVMLKTHERKNERMALRQHKNLNTFQPQLQGSSARHGEILRWCHRLWRAERRVRSSPGRRAPPQRVWAKWNMDEGVAESWEEAADSGVSTLSVVEVLRRAQCRCDFDFFYCLQGCFQKFPRRRAALTATKQADSVANLVLVR